MKRVEGRAQTSNFKIIMEFLTKIKDYVNYENQNMRMETNLDRSVNQFLQNEQNDLEDTIVEGGDDMDGIEGMEEEEKKEEEPE